MLLVTGGAEAGGSVRVGAGGGLAGGADSGVEGLPAVGVEDPLFAPDAARASLSLNVSLPDPVLEADWKLLLLDMLVEATPKCDDSDLSPSSIESDELGVLCKTGPAEVSRCIVGLRFIGDSRLDGAAAE